MCGSMGSKQRGTYPYSYKQEISGDQTVQNCLALRWQLMHNVFWEPCNQCTSSTLEIDHWDSAAGGQGQRNPQMFVSAVGWGVRRG